MSELIDSIFDVAKIAKEKKEIEDILDALKGDILGFSSEIKKLYEAIRAAKSVEDLAKQAKSINDAMIKGSETTKVYQTELEKLRQKTEQLTGAEKAANIEIAKARLELAAAQKTVKDAAVAEIEAAAATGKLGDSYNELQSDLKKAQIAYRDMTKAERDSASGQELLKKISTTQQELKDLDEGMKIYTRNVGNYASANEGAAKSSVDMAAGMDQLGGGAASTAKGIISATKSALAFIATPIGAAFAAIAGVVAILVKAFSRNEEAMGKLKTVTGALSGVFGGFMNALKPVVNFIADYVVKYFEAMGAVAEKASGLLSKGLKALGFDKAAAGVDKMTASVKENAKAGQELAKLQAEQTVNERELNRIRFEYLKEQEKFRQVRDDVSKSTSERIKANDALGASLKKQSDIEMGILKQALLIAEQRVKIDGETTENLDKVAEAKANIADLEERINGFQSEQLVNSVGLRKEAADLAKAQSQLITDAQRRLADAKLNAMQEGEAKQIALSEESFKRQIEDLKANGQHSAELEQNLKIAHEIELQKIKDDFAKQAKEKEAADLEKRIADFEKNMQKEADLLQAGFKDKETELKKEYAVGKKSREQYEEALAELQANALKEANDATIEALQKELEIADISADKRAEISAKLRDLQIQNENAVLDATIKSNNKKIEADKAAADKRKEIATQIVDAGMELFGAINDYQAQQSENRIAEIEKEQAASDAYFEKRQENLDNSIMSDENRASIQKNLDEEKAKRDAELLKKQQAEKTKQAKWEKSQALVSAFVGTANAVVGALGSKPWGVWNFIFAALAGAAGAVQIAKIASQQIPAYATGTDNHPGGLSIWGEVRPEVAVTPAGEIMYAERPTVTNFDAGTKIFKSVEDYERNYTASKVGGKPFEIDYEEMGEHMPVSIFNFDSNGIHTHFTRQGNRIADINRKTKIGN